MSEKKIEWSLARERPVRLAQSEDPVHLLSLTSKRRAAFELRGASGERSSGRRSLLKIGRENFVEMYNIKLWCKTDT